MSVMLTHVSASPVMISYAAASSKGRNKETHELSRTQCLNALTVSFTFTMHIKVVFHHDMVPQADTAAMCLWYLVCMHCSAC